MSPVARVALVGIGGYGRVHLRHLLDFHARGEVRLLAAVAFDPDPDGRARAELAHAGCEIFPSFDELFAALPRLRLDLVIVPTPIHLHARMTIALLRAGVNVLVEKPVAATVADTEEIIRTAQETGRIVAVGFQYLHAPEVRDLKQRLLAGAIGPLRRLVVHAAWPRNHAYYLRNKWAGRLRLGSDVVHDSPVNNAMSHFLMLMLFLAGDEAGAAQPVGLAAELYRAQAIESFDTGVVRLVGADGCQIDFYGTHSSQYIDRPSLMITGTNGTAEWEQDGYARLQGPAGRWEQLAGSESATREKMLREVLARLRGEGVFICRPELALAHVRCVERLHARVPITPLAPDALARRRQGDELFTYVPGLDGLMDRAARDGLSLAAAGAAWAVPEPTRVNFD